VAEVGSESADGRAELRARLARLKTSAPPQAIPITATAPPAAAPAPPNGGSPAADGRFVLFNFDNADVEIVVQAASEVVGFNYVIAPAARGKKITVQTQGRVPVDEVLGLLLTVLDANALAAVKSGTVYRIVPKEGTAQAPVRTIIGRDPDASIPGDEIVTQTVALQYLSAADAVTLLRPLAAPQAALGAHRDSNLLVLTDTAANVRRLLDLLKVTDVPGAIEEARIIPLRHADAHELAALLTQLFAGGRARPGPLGALAPAGPQAPGAGAPRAPAAQPESGPGRDRPPLIVPERRSNSIVVQARKQEADAIQRLIGELDVDIQGGQRVFTYFLENSKAKDLAATLESIYGRAERGAARTAGLDPRAGFEPARVAGPAVTPAAARTPQALPGQEDGGAPPPDIRFIADETTNAIIVTTYPRAWREIEATIKTLDRMPRQVLIEVVAAEVTLSDDTRLGVEWAIRSGTVVGTSSSSGLIPGLPIIGDTGLSTLSGLSLFAMSSDRFFGVLNAFAQENRVNILSTPSIMTAENKKAVINVSTSVPIVTSQQVPVATGGTTGNSITQSVEYRDIGIILTVTPRIGEQGTVALDVKTEFNQVGPTEPPPINSPRFDKREADTSVVLLNNQTLVLGGLINTRRIFVHTGIPYLNKIPVLGYLFGSREEQTEKTELLLILTPRVVGTAVEASRITEEMRQRTPGLRDTLRPRD
jgi:general secretion pathway protein D